MKLAALLTASIPFSGALLKAASGSAPTMQEMNLVVADALEELAGGLVPLVWLHGLACSGCSVSFLNTSYPDAAEVLTSYVSLEYHSVLSTATGHIAMQALEDRLAAGKYILIVEGAVPVGMPSACRVGEEDFAKQLLRAAANATAILSLGACAAFGGIPAAAGNVTGAVSASSYLLQNKVKKPLINIPGCPANPDWLVGALVHLLKFGQPELNEQGCPNLFFGEILHNRCPQFYNYNAGKYAKSFGDDGCLFKLGCLGIRTLADCSTRRWNSKLNWCVEAGAPCIGCTQPEFALDKNFPFYRLREMKSA